MLVNSSDASDVVIDVRNRSQSREQSILFGDEKDPLRVDVDTLCGSGNGVIDRVGNESRGIWRRRRFQPFSFQKWGGNDVISKREAIRESAEISGVEGVTVQPNHQGVGILWLVMQR